MTFTSFDSYFNSNQEKYFQISFKSDFKLVGDIHADMNILRNIEVIINSLKNQELAEKCPTPITSFNLNGAYNIKLKSKNIDMVNYVKLNSGLNSITLCPDSLVLYLKQGTSYPIFNKISTALKEHG